MFGKKRMPVYECASCGRPIAEGRKICACGAATRYMTFEERARYEVEQWRLHREQAAQAS